MEQHLRGAGFSFIDLMGQARRPPVVPSRRLRPDQLLWADALFAAAHPDGQALLAQAVVFAGVYRKLSLAERALATYDALHGTGLAALVEVLD